MPCKDHLGNSYPSRRAMARAWEISEGTLSARLKAGWSLKKALTAPLRALNNRKARIIVDHLGQKFPSLRAAADAWGLSHGCLFHRLESWPLEKAFTEPVRHADHIGAAREHHAQMQMQKQAKAARGLAKYCAGYPDGDTFKEIPTEATASIKK